MSGKPLRFLGVTMAIWVGARAVMLWPVAAPQVIPAATIAASHPDGAVEPVAIQPAARPIVVATSVMASSVKEKVRSARRPLTPVKPAALIAWPTQAMPAPVSPVARTPEAPARQTLLAPPTMAPTLDRAHPDRWSASAWVFVRDGQGIAPGLGTGQLGGSQAGLRVAYALTGRTAIVARIASPLRGMDREAALGVEWRPTKLPVRLAAEYRASLDGGGSGPAAGLIAGTGPAPLMLGFDLETYGQAGLIRRRRTEPFAEGAGRLSHPVGAVGRIKVDLGLGAWGGAQRDARRLDAGPSLGVRLPVAGKSLRMSLDCGIM